MANDSVISDDLLRKLVGVGHVDLLVGLPTLNHADTIADLVRAVESSFRTYFPRQRTVIVNLDGGSSDDTSALVEHGGADAGASGAVSHGLRSMHRISTPHQGLRGHASAVQVICAAADLVQAKVIVMLDPDVMDLSPQGVATLAAPVRDSAVDLVAPVYRRPFGDGLLTTQLLRPLVRAVYGWRVSEPLMGEFACSGRFAAHCVGQAVWSSDTVQAGGNLWLTGAALAGGFRMGEARFGARLLRPGAPRPELPELFRRVVTTAFAMIDTHVDYWLPRAGVDAVPEVGALADQGEPAGSRVLHPRRLLENFGRDVRNLNEILRVVLRPETLTALTSAADAGDSGTRFPDALWATVVAECLVASHRGVMLRDHVIQALLPLYVARTGAFLLEHADATSEDRDAAVEGLCVSFEQARTCIVERWMEPAVR